MPRKPFSGGLRDAAGEIRNYQQYDYVLVNHRVDDSTLTLQSIVRAERVRRIRMEEHIEPILRSFEPRPAIVILGVRSNKMMDIKPRVKRDAQHSR